MAMDLYLIRLDGTYARYSDVVADPVLANMTGKGEPYRDILAAVGSAAYMGTATFQNGPGFVTVPTYGNSPPTITSVALKESDELSHEPPRQADQIYTFWKFEFATVALTPRYSYAEFRRGDIIANTAPNTDPA